MMLSNILNARFRFYFYQIVFISFSDFANAMQVDRI